MDRPILNNNVVTIPEGYGYWDITCYPWGGDFHRAKTDIQGNLKRILDTYNNNAPRKVAIEYNGRTLGVEF
jgi:hypothetical protein